MATFVAFRHGVLVIDLNEAAREARGRGADPSTGNCQ